MRMNQNDEKTAEQILDEYSIEDLIRIFRQFGEEKHAVKIAGKITEFRINEKITKVSQVINLIDKCIPSRFRVKSYARIFQALRIEVNRELEELENVLPLALEILKQGGRLGIISYHSLEDRMVKNFIQHEENPCECPPGIPYCVCGKKPRMRRIKPFPIVPSEKEIQSNRRARSARFRVGEKL
jgi:16S rRNA (cytosine1402-N4)-methyltransferase